MLTRTHKESLVWAGVILAGTCIWFVLNNIDRGEHKYPLYKKIYNAENKTWFRIPDVINLRHVLDQPDEYINETNAIRRLYNAIGASHLYLGVPADQVYERRELAILAGQPKSNQTKCLEEINWIKQQVEAKRDYFDIVGKEGKELTDFMDSYGRPGAGIFAELNNVWVGLHEKCLAATLRNGQIRGQYCLSRFRFASWPSKPNRFDPEPALKLGVCLPDSCDSLAIESRELNETISWLAKFQVQEQLASRLELDQLFCIPNAESPLRKLTIPGKIFLYLIGAWLSLFFLITCLYELIWRRKKDVVVVKTWLRLVSGFTLRNSVKSFTLKRQLPPEAAVNTSFLEFVKLMMAYGILLSHSMIITVYKCRTRQGNIDAGISNFAKFFYSFGRFVDTFLILFGLTMSYTLLQKFNLKKLKLPVVWVAINLAIFLRIAPIHALILNFNKWITPLLGSGPWWDYGGIEHGPRHICKHSSWLDSIPMLTNLGFLPAPPCNPPAWFLGPYTQIALIIPLLTYVIASLPSQIFAITLIILISLISSANVSLALYNQEVVAADTVGDYGAFMVAIVEKYESTGYMSSLGRFGSVIIGVYSGYLLHLYQEGKIRKWPSWFASKLFNVLIILIHAALFVFPVYGKAIFSPDTPSSMTKLQFALINLFMVPFWPVINCILIINACTTYKNHVVVRFMAHPVWGAAGKLGLAIYLIHFEVLMYILTYGDYAPSNGHAFNVLRTGCFGLIVTTCIAIVVYLFFEAPIAYLNAKFIIPAIQGTRPSNCDKPYEKKQPIACEDDILNSQNILNVLENGHQLDGVDRVLMDQFGKEQKLQQNGVLNKLA